MQVIHATITEELFCEVGAEVNNESLGRRTRSLIEGHVEVGSNTSTVALGVVGGDEKGTQCLGV
jgi:hypothetical protein